MLAEATKGGAAPSFGGATVAVTGLYRYPIKSCAGTALTEATLEPRGIVHDRELLVVDAATGAFLTQRELPRLALVTPDIDDREVRVAAPGQTPLAAPLVKDGPRRAVMIWRDTCEAVDQGDELAAWFGDFLHAACRVVRMAPDFVRGVDPTYATGPADQVGFVDGFPLLLIAEESLAELNRRLPDPLPMNRFRPNIVIAGGAPHGEDFVGRFQIGAITFSAVKFCARCAITTTDQATARVGKEPLTTLATYRRSKRGVLFGQNVVHAATGTIRVGDPVIAREAQRDIEAVGYRGRE